MSQATLPLTPAADIDLDRIKATVRAIPDFPKPGILFRDVMPVLQDPELYRQTIDWFARAVAPGSVDVVVGIESRGFIFGAPLAYALGVGFVPVRKRGKLPGDVVSHTYDLEYGTDTIEMHQGALAPHTRVLLVDDLLATGGTAGAAVKLITSQGASIVQAAFMVKLDALQGQKQLPEDLLTSVMIHY